MQKEFDTEILNALSNWKSIIQSYQIPSTKKAIIQISNSFIPYLALWTLMYFTWHWSILFTIMLCFVNAFFLVRIFIIQHDCGHQSFLKSKKWNAAIGYFCSLFSSLPFNYWAKVHNHHHGHTGQLEERDIGDVKFLTVTEYREMGKLGRLQYRLFRNPIVLFIVSPIVYFTISNRFPFEKFKGIFRSVKWAQVRNNLIILLVYIALGALIGWVKFIVIQLSTIFIFAVISFWFFYIQHQHETAYNEWRKNWNYVLAAVRGATYYRLPKVFQWLTGNIGLHHIHHLSSRIPNYNLEKCMKENPILNKYANILTFKESLKCIHNKLWDEQKKRMISFREFYTLEKMRLSM
ncbi:MAG: fatty acid desaturase [Saprospiraceae bacterium]|nr:fatty acid desaturase [Bacteroidia bacterium]NNE14795.1 fatty acid desaturase [Saprospiraceae bacterium]NNL93452.1 fatty acid desaturase [Saprospiraceae bacterium]